MQRMTIVKIDNIVVIDGEYYKVDCSDLPENFHALMWDETKGEGEVEWTGKPKPSNTPIDSIENYKKYVDRWKAAKIEHEALLAQELSANATANTAG